MKVGKAPRWAWVVLLVGVTSACGPIEVEHSPATNLLDPETASIETGTGHWAAWFGTRVSRQAAAARLGAGGLRVDLIDPFWGIQLDQYPGAEASAGAHRLSFWVRAAQGAALAGTVTVTWRNSAADDLKTDTFKTPFLTEAWTRISLDDLVAPTGTQYVALSLDGKDAEDGDQVDVDGFFFP